MDGTVPSYTTTLASASKDLPKDVDNTFVSTLAFDSHNVSSLCFSKGTKRKWKEMEEESSLDLGLSINLSRGDNRSSNAKKVSAGKLDLLKIMNPVLDLQLSLSTVPTASDVTTVSQGLIPYQNYAGSPALAPRAEIVDDGSTSSRWKTGSLVSPLQNVEFSTPSTKTMSIAILSQ
ncbi:hypothetical protein DH2020_048625 [Rehmannia glutinosa]|uniref:Uncharacterized protein n=1 Tax=Rehmannia glutinosa TaxID=99300 RepID=A0ABR0U5D9_REHGL